MTDNARRLHEGGHLRKGLTVARAAEVLWTYSSPELYELLVQRRAMPLKDYGRFIVEAISAAVLDGEGLGTTWTATSSTGREAQRSRAPAAYARRRYPGGRQRRW